MNTIIIEFGTPFQWKFGYFKTSVMLRFWWGFVAIGVSKLTLKELSSGKYIWRT